MKNITTKTVARPRIEPITGPAIQELLRELPALDGEVPLGVIVLFTGTLVFIFVDVGAAVIPVADAVIDVAEAVSCAAKASILDAWLCSACTCGSTVVFAHRLTTFIKSVSSPDEGCVPFTIAEVIMHCWQLPQFVRKEEFAVHELLVSKAPMAVLQLAGRCQWMRLEGIITEG